MTTAHDPGSRRRARLRRTVLAVSVLDDVDLTPGDDGVVVDGPRPAHLTWDELQDAAGDTSGQAAHRRLSRLLRLHARACAIGDDAAAVLRDQARLLALPPGHAAHPGAGWVLHRPMGGALDCGIGLLGALDDPDEVVPLPPSLVRTAAVPVQVWWPGLVAHASAMGRLAVDRLRRDEQGPRRRTTSAIDHQLVLRPVGGVDVPTLLTTHVVRRYLAASDGSGLRAAAVPMRSRGWYDLARIDPAFVQAAWAATDELERGLPRPVLVTADEVVLAPERIDLRDAPATVDLRDGTARNGRATAG
jgi:hypothetical protein